jgi:hypothetical protein
MKDSRGCPYISAAPALTSMNIPSGEWIKIASLIVSKMLWKVNSLYRNASSACLLPTAIVIFWASSLNCGLGAPPFCR